MSLIELLVALGLGAFLLLGIVNVFLSNKESTQIEQSLSRLQENGRIALDLVTEDLRDAFYVGCNSTAGTMTVMADGLNFTGLLGFERSAANWTPALVAKLNGINASARVGSDVINVQHGRDLDARIIANITSASTSVSVDENTSCVSDGDFVVVGSCSTSHLFEVTNTPDCGAGATSFAYRATSNTPSSIQPGYSSDDRLVHFFDTTWFVADTGRRRTSTEIPVYALYRLSNGVTEEMVEGVEYMQVLYGQRLPNGNMRYVPANDANLTMSQVVSLRIALLIQSFEPVLDAPDSAVYQVGDQAIDSAGTPFLHNGDRSLRRVFHTTVLLRNRPDAG